MPQPPNLNALLQQAQKMQADMMAAQEKLKDEKVEASAGGGMVKVVMSGDLELKSLEIDPDAVDPEDVEMLQDMVMAAINEAMRQAMDLQGKATGMGGMDASAAMDALGGWASAASAAAAAPVAPAASRAAAPRTAPRAASRGSPARPAAPAPGHRAGQAPRHRQPHRTAPGLPRAARVSRRTRTRSRTRSATSRTRSGSARSASTSPRVRAARSAPTSGATRR